MQKERSAVEHKIAYRVLRIVGTLVVAHPGWVIALYAILTCVAVGATSGVVALPSISSGTTIHGLELRTGQNDLVSNDLAYNQRYLRFLESFGDLEFLYVVILVDGEVERAASLAAAIGAEIEALEEHVEEVDYRIPLDQLRDLAFLNPGFPDEAVEDLATALTGARQALSELAEVRSFEDLLRFFESLFDPTFALENRGFAAGGGRVMEAVLEGLTSVLEGKAPPSLEASLQRSFLGHEPHPRELGYFFSDNEEIAFVQIMPRKNYATLGLISEPLRAIRGALARVRERREFSGMRFGLTGRPVLQADEMETTHRDMIRATILALVAVVALFVLCFRRLRRPLLAAITLLVAIALTFGLVTVTIGYLTILSIVFAAMLVGLGVDFGIHFLARYQDELLERDDIDAALKKTLLSTGVGIWTGGVTTATAFFMAVFVDFKGLQELGFVAGSGVLICLGAMLTLFPALIAVTDHHLRRRRTLHPARPVRLPTFGFLLRHPRTVLVVLGALTLAGVYRLGGGAPYDYNLLNLQAHGLESVEYEQLLLERSERSTWYACFVVDSIAEVDRTLARLGPACEAGIVGAVESIRDLVTPEIAARAKTLRGARSVVEKTRIAEPSSVVSVAGLASAAAALGRRLDGLTAAARIAGGENAAKELDALRAELTTLESRLRAAGDEAERPLADYQKSWFAELSSTRATLERMLDLDGDPVERLPVPLRRRYVSHRGDQFLVYAYPARDIWEEEHMKEFVAAVRAVDENVTGTPIQVYESARLMREGFLRAAAYSLVAVFVIVMIDLRSVVQSLLVLVPLGFGLLWLLEVMLLCGLSFNLANFFSLPILIGVGVDGGVHVLHRYRESASVWDVLKTTGSAVTLSFLTTISGFGALALAHHRGVASLGHVMALGCVLILAATIVLLPALLSALYGRRRG